MTLIDEIRRRFAYDDWCHARLIEAFRSFAGDATPWLKHLAHIPAANAVWQTRLEGRGSNALEIWPAWSLDQCAASLR